MKIEWMIEEVIESCRREFRGVVEDAATRGVNAIPGLESVVLEKALHFGAVVVSKILQGLTCEEPSRVACPSCHAQAGGHGRRERQARTLLGKITYERREYACLACGNRFALMDYKLGLAKGEELTAEAKKTVAQLSASTDFPAACGILGRLSALEMSESGVRDVAERIGARVAVAREVAARGPGRETAPRNAPAVLVLQADGVMGRFEDGWHEVMIGAAATIEKRPEGADEVALKRLETVTTPRDRELFWACFERMAQRQGLEAGADVLFISDAGGGNFEAADRFAPHAVQILDFYHAAQHLHTALEAALGEKNARAEKQFERLRKRLLCKGGAAVVIRALEKLLRIGTDTRSRDALKIVKREIAYFRNNQHRMRYAWFRSKGWPIGSGLIEGCCKSVFGRRFKQSGMTWSRKGMAAIAALRDAAMSGRWELDVLPRLAA